MSQQQLERVCARHPKIGLLRWTQGSTDCPLCESEKKKEDAVELYNGLVNDVSSVIGKTPQQIMNPLSDGESTLEK